MTDRKLLVSAGPHVRGGASTTSVMGDVLIALLPAVVASVLVFGTRALLLEVVCVAASILFEYLFRKITKRTNTISDLSAAVTGLLLGLNLPSDIIEYIAQNIAANVRQLEGTLNKILAYRDLLDDQVNEETVGRAIRDMLKKSNDFAPTPKIIVSYICNYFNVDEDTLRGQSRSRDVVAARQIAIYLIRRMSGMSLNDIGKEFGDRDHSTIMHSLDKVEKQMRTDPAFAEKVKEITTNINSKK